MGKIEGLTVKDLEIPNISPLIYNLLGKLDVDQEIILESVRLLDYLRQKIKGKNQVH